jgi:hypothetical protein
MGAVKPGDEDSARIIYRDGSYTGIGRYGLCRAALQRFPALLFLPNVPALSFLRRDHQDGHFERGEESAFFLAIHGSSLQPFQDATIAARLLLGAPCRRRTESAQPLFTLSLEGSSLSFEGRLPTPQAAHRTMTAGIPPAFAMSRPAAAASSSATARMVA